MAGNVAQWVNDWMATYTYPGSPSAPPDPNHPVPDPQGPPGPDAQYGNAKVIRGGSYQSSRAGVRCTLRDGQSDLEQCFPYVGFRTAYTLLNQ